MPVRQRSSLRIVDLRIRPARVLVDRRFQQAVLDLIVRVHAAVVAEARRVRQRRIVRVSGATGLHGRVQGAGLPSIEEVHVETEACCIAHREHERLVLRRVQPVERLDVEPVLDEDLREARGAVRDRATVDAVGGRVGHVCRWVGGVEILPAPARGHRHGRCEAIGAGRKAFGKPHGFHVRELRRAVAVTEPFQAGAVWTRVGGVFGPHHRVAGYHPELLRELLDVCVVFI